MHDSRSDALRYQLPGLGFPLTAAVTSPDGSRLAAADVLGQAWIREAEGPGQFSIPFRPTDKLLTFTPSGRSLVLKTSSGSLRFLDATNGRLERALEGFASLRSLKFNASGDRFAWVEPARPGLLHIQRGRDGSRVVSLPIPGAISDFTWHPNGRLIAVAWSKNHGIWSTESGQQQALSTGHEAQVVGLSFNPTGDFLATASWDRTTRFWHTDTGRELLSMNGSGNQLSFSRNGSQLAYKSWDNRRVELLEFTPPQLAPRLALPRGGFTAGATFSPDGRLLAVCTDFSVFVCAPPHPIPLAVLPVSRTANAEFSLDGRWLHTGGETGLARWPLAFDANSRSLRVGSPEIIASTRGQAVRLIRSSGDGKILVAQLENGGVLSLRPGDDSAPVPAESEITSKHLFCVDHRGTLALSWSERAPRQLEIWNPQTGRILTNVMESATIRDACLSPDERWAAVATTARIVLRHLPDWKERSRIEHPEVEGRHRLAFSPDGRLLAAAISDRELWLMETATGHTLAAIPTDRMLSGLTFHPSGHVLAATYESGYYQTWDLNRLRAELAALHLDWPEPAAP